ncbi:copine-8-like isoform X1 [Rhopilema esculentum]|uniref:copine-8-like isoform X1 n=1 Tax=Rhopilema esculentum TaxID=499914 RepID=UPI0031DF0257
MSASHPPYPPVNYQQMASAAPGSSYPPPGYHQYPAQPPQQEIARPVSQVELHVSCRDLLDMDTFSKSDPLVVMYILDKTSKNWREYGRTEVIMNTLNPDFVKAFVIDYYFEEVQKLRFEVYDVDSESSNLKSHDFIGHAECTLGSIFGESGGRLQTKLNNPKHAKCGFIIVSAEELRSCKDIVNLQFCGRKLDKKDFFGKSDPFLTISRCNEDGSFSVVHRTNVIKSTLNPTWSPFRIASRTLCNGDDVSRTLLIECYDWNNNGSHSLIGKFETSLSQLANFRTGKTSYELINPKYKAKKKSYKNSGLINVIDCRIEQRHSFLDFIKGGTELCFAVAIDFTASNGAPSNPSSLHYINPYTPNQYVQALNSVGAIIQDYDSDKLFPAFGFGAQIPPNFHVSHEFALNFNPGNPNCPGVDGIVAAYYNSIHNCRLYGPTNFAPVINSTARIAEMSARNKPGSQYYILLIITDGIITDMERTKDAIVKAALLPMSIIIVGVGSDAFEAMEELDGDEVRLSANGVSAARDIVQFVPFRDYLGRDNQYDTSSGERLAKDVLAELPGQVEEYMTMNKIIPKKTGES